MDITGTQILKAHRTRVWDALNTPEILQACIPGCESLSASGQNQYTLVMVAAVGPVKAKFNAKLTLSDVVQGASYTMTFDGSGGAAGFGKGQASVTLTDAEGDSASTQLDYTAHAQVGGKIAQVGARLIDGVAKKLSEAFFKNFKAQVESIEAEGSEAEDIPAEHTS